MFAECEDGLILPVRSTCFHVANNLHFFNKAFNAVVVNPTSAAAFDNAIN